MTESAPETTGPTAEVSPTAEQGTPEENPTPTDGGTPTDGSAGDGGSADPAAAPVASAESADKPEWNVETHGALAEDDPRREMYDVVGE